MKNKINVILIVLCVAFPLIVGYISSLITSNAMTAFNSMNKPPLAPPGWLFPIVWSVLYVLMGLASYLIITSASSFKALALIIYMLQLVLNFFWSLIFFNLEMYWFALVWLLTMWVLIIILLVVTSKFSLIAMFCLLPLAIWSTFAAYLNLMIARMN